MLGSQCQTKSRDAQAHVHKKFKRHQNCHYPSTAELKNLILQFISLLYCYPVLHTTYKYYSVFEQFFAYKPHSLVLGLHRDPTLHWGDDANAAASQGTQTQELPFVLGTDLT